MRNAKVMRNLASLAVLVLCGLWSTVSYAAGQSTQTPPASKKSIKAPALQQQPFFVRGTVTVSYPSQSKSTGQGMKNINVDLFVVTELGQVMPVGRKTTDGEGRYAFMLLPGDKGKRYKIVPRLLQHSCGGHIAFVPEENIFTLQNSMTADFALSLPSAPDTVISIKCATNWHAIQMPDPSAHPYFSFSVTNKACFPSAPSKVILSYYNETKSSNCVQEKAVDVIPGQGFKIVEVDGCPGAMGGFPFKATLQPQPDEMDTGNNSVQGDCCTSDFCSPF